MPPVACRSGSGASPPPAPAAVRSVAGGAPALLAGAPPGAQPLIRQWLAPVARAQRGDTATAWAVRARRPPDGPATTPLAAVSYLPAIPFRASRPGWRSMRRPPRGASLGGGALTAGSPGAASAGASRARHCAGRRYHRVGGRPRRGTRRPRRRWRYAGEPAPAARPPRRPPPARRTGHRAGRHAAAQATWTPPWRWPTPAPRPTSAP